MPASAAPSAPKASDKVAMRRSGTMFESTWSARVVIVFTGYSGQNLAHHPLRGRRHRGWVPAGTQFELIQQPVLLEHVEVHRRIRGVAKFHRLGIARQSHDLVWLIAAEPAAAPRVAVDPDMLSNWADAGKIASRHGLIYNRDARAGGIAESEIASRKQRYAERFKIPRRHEDHARPLPILGLLDMPLRKEVAAPRP